MAKYVGKSTITEHKGLAKLKTFCAYNTPFLICRDETITDVGIDGEIEICYKNEHGKVEATGDRLKFQLKSTESTNSYIKNENETEFHFNASKDDVEYWSKHKQDVILIIYDAIKDILYGKKISNTDLHSQSQSKTSIPIVFRKNECVLDSNNFDFHKKYSTSIKQRLNFDLTEDAMTNIFRLKYYPKVMYSYKTQFKNKEAIFKQVPENTVIPQFLIYNHVIYTFVKPINQGDYFKSNIVNVDTQEIIEYKNLAQNKVMRNHYVELIKIYIKRFLSSKGIYYNKDYSRFYFGIREGEAVRSILAKTRKQGRKSPKEVAKFYVYGKYEFYRHTAFEIDFIHTESTYIAIMPTYLITSDRKTPADGKLASKFIITQKSREFNPNVANSIHTIFAFLANENYEGITIYNDDNIDIEFSRYIPLQLPFSISTDDKGFSQHLKREKKNIQQESIKLLFD